MANNHIVSLQLELLLVRHILRYVSREERLVGTMMGSTIPSLGNMWRIFGTFWDQTPYLKADL